MVKAPGRKLKVFQAQFGFHDSVVAAPSQAEALRAWGIRQNLFAEGRAQTTADPQAIEAARAHPLVPMRRAVGSVDPFELEPTRLPTIPDPARRRIPKAAMRGQPEPAAPAADRSELDAAEAAVRALDERRKQEGARLLAEAAELDEKIAARQAAYVAARKAAAGAVASARQAYRKSGGKD
jgi:hypothetical protein